MTKSASAVETDLRLKSETSEMIRFQFCLAKLHDAHVLYLYIP